MIWITLYLYIAGMILFCMLGDRLVPKDQQMRFVKLTSVLWPLVLGAGIIYDIYCWVKGE